MMEMVAKISAKTPMTTTTMSWITMMTVTADWLTGLATRLPIMIRMAVKIHQKILMTIMTKLQTQKTHVLKVI